MSGLWIVHLFFSTMRFVPHSHWVIKNALNGQRVSVHAEMKETLKINIAVQVSMVMNCNMNEEAVIPVL